MELPDKISAAAWLPITLAGLMALAGAGSALAQPATVAGPVEAEVTKVIDGDTLAVEAKIWLDQWVSVHIRLRGVDTPEMHGHCEAERAGAEAAMNFVTAEVEKGPITLTDISTDKYGGRAVANVITASGEDLGRLLLKNGLARPYTGGHKSGWCGGAG